MDYRSAPWLAKIKLSVLIIDSMSLSGSVIMVTSAHAKKHWYYGLTPKVETDPVLIARSSNVPFRYESHPFVTRYPYGEPMPKRKVMSVLGCHPIMDIYDEQLRVRVRLALSKIRWQTVDIIRLGYEGEFDNPPVILISTALSQAQEDSAQEAVNNIRTLMIQHNLMDVQVELKSGVYHSQFNNTDKINPIDFNLTPRPGCSIGRLSSGDAGTLGLFVKIDGEYYGLTSKQVLEPMNLCNSVHILSDYSTAYTVPSVVLQPAQRDIEEEETNLREMIASLQNDIDEFDEDEREANAGLAPPIVRSRKYENQLDWESFKAEHERLQALIEFKPSMALGTVYAVPGSLMNPDHGCVRDWGLVKITKEWLQSTPQNIFPEMEREFRRNRLVTQRKRRVNIERFIDVPACEILPVSEVNCILQISSTHDDIESPSLRVIKHGRTSGWTCGSLNELRSDVQQRYPGCPEFVSTEWCVVNIPGLNNFSYPGDSGSCVLDYEGKIVGLLHSGNGKEYIPSPEIAYITPMEWILEDIKNTLGTDDVILEMKPPQ